MQPNSRRNNSTSPAKEKVKAFNCTFKIHEYSQLKHFSGFYGLVRSFKEIFVKQHWPLREISPYDCVALDKYAAQSE